jgi:hypothetical protein
MRAAARMRTLLDTPTPLMANSTAQPGHGLGPDGVAAGPTAPEPPGRKQPSTAYARPRGPGVSGSAKAALVADA